MEGFRIGDLELREATRFLSVKGLPDKYWEVVKWSTNYKGQDYCYTISTFNNTGDVVSVGDRPFKLGKEDWELYKNIINYWYNEN